MFTGQLFALPVYFLAVNYVAFAFSSGARYVIGYLGYGLGMDTVPEFLILRILSPMNYLYNNVRFVFRQSYNQETDLMSGCCPTGDCGYLRPMWLQQLSFI